MAEPVQSRPDLDLRVTLIAHEFDRIFEDFSFSERLAEMVGRSGAIINSTPLCAILPETNCPAIKEGEQLHVCDVRFLPIVCAYACALGLVEEIDRLCGPKRGISGGQIVLALVLDALSGRSLPDRPTFRDDFV